MAPELIMTINVAGLFLANAGLILWFRAESRSDWRHMDSKLDSIAQQNREAIEASAKENRDAIEASAKESRDAIEASASKNREAIEASAKECREAIQASARECRTLIEAVAKESRAELKDFHERLLEIESRRR